MELKNKLKYSLSVMGQLQKLIVINIIFFVLGIYFTYLLAEKFSNKNLQNSFHIIDTVEQLKNILIKWQK